MAESVGSFKHPTFLMPPSGSSVEDDKRTTEFKMSLAVISTADLAKSLKEVLLEHHKSLAERYTIEVHIAERVKRVLVNKSMVVDYYIMYADPRRADAAEKITKDLSLLSTAFLATGRCVVVVSWPEKTPASFVARCSASVHDVARKNMLHKVVQQDDGPKGKKLLADQLLRLVRTARGLNATGVPNFTTCFNPGPEWISPLAELPVQQSASNDDDSDEESNEPI